MTEEELQQHKADLKQRGQKQGRCEYYGDRCLNPRLTGEEFFAYYHPDFGLESCFCHIHDGEKVSGGDV